MFAEGFEKVASLKKLKHLAVAGMLAASPVKAKASDMAGTVGKALHKSFEHTPEVQHATKKINEFVEKGRRIKLFGHADEVANTAAKSTSSVAGKTSKGPSANLYLKDANKLELDYGDFKGTLDPGRQHLNVGWKRSF